MSGLVLFFDLLHFFYKRTKSTHRFMLQLSYKCRKYKHISLLYYREQTYVINSQYLFEKSSGQPALVHVRKTKQKRFTGTC